MPLEGVTPKMLFIWLAVMFSVIFVDETFLGGKMGDSFTPPESYEALKESDTIYKIYVPFFAENSVQKISNSLARFEDENPGLVIVSSMSVFKNGHGTDVWLFTDVRTAH